MIRHAAIPLLASISAHAAGAGVLLWCGGSLLPSVGVRAGRAGPPDVVVLIEEPAGEVRRPDATVVDGPPTPPDRDDTAAAMPVASPPEISGEARESIPTPEHESPPTEPAVREDLVRETLRALGLEVAEVLAGVSAGAREALRAAASAAVPAAESPVHRTAPGAAPREELVAPGGAGAPGVAEAPSVSPGNPAPEYPRDALRRRQSGTVSVHVVIEADGAVSGVSLNASSGVASLDEAALAAVRRWRFTPSRAGGLATRGEANIPVRFVLQR